VGQEFGGGYSFDNLTVGEVSRIDHIAPSLQGRLNDHGTQQDTEKGFVFSVHVALVIHISSFLWYYYSGRLLNMKVSENE
jgi:hypothetical protein